MLSLLYSIYFIYLIFAYSFSYIIYKFKITQIQQMFSDFQQIFNKVTNLPSQITKQDLSLTPQKYLIGNKQFQQLKLLSQGAFGFIWLAEDVNTKKQYALKRVICMTPERFKQAQQQKYLMSIFPKCQNIVQYFEGDIVNIQNNKMVITVMQLCKGGTLFDLLQKKQNVGFTQNQIVKIATEIVIGLMAIHSTGYFHRDIKIQNVLLGEGNHYKLCDFGSCSKDIVKFSQINPKEYDNIRQQMESLTTPMYRPPQIADPYLKYTVSQKVDIWMLGCVIYTLSYFTHPFLDSNNVGIASGKYKFLKYPSQTKYNCSDKLKDLIRHMLTPNPSYRPSAKQLLQLLQNWNKVDRIKLNPQAERRKKQQMQNQVQMQRLNRKVVDYDGDIPIQKLMELQLKMKNKTVEQKTTSFVNNKAMEKLKQQNNRSNNMNSYLANNNTNNTNNTNHNSNSFANKNQFFAKLDKPKQQINIQNLWGNNFLNTKSKVQTKNQNKFDAFSQFSSFGANNSNLNHAQTKPKQNQINFEQLFDSSNDSYPNAVKKQSKTEDLLDL